MPLPRAHTRPLPGTVHRLHRVALEPLPRARPVVQPDDSHKLWICQDSTVFEAVTKVGAPHPAL